LGFTLAKQTKLEFQGEKVDATELKFRTVHEEWNEYHCEDGSTVRLKTVAAKIYRTAKKRPDGEPIYIVRSSNLIDVSVGEGEEEVQ